MTTDHCRFAHDAVGHASTGLANPALLSALESSALAASHDVAEFGPTWEYAWIDLGGEG